MAVKDAIVLNTTGSNFQAVQSGDTIRIKGDSAELLSIENSSDTRVFSVGTTTTSVNIEGNVTSSKPISGSSTSTASFGYFVADTYEGDAREIAATLPRSGDILSGSSQIAADISGSFTSGFTFGVTADQLYEGVSGSNSAHSASVSGSTRGMSASGSDYTHLKADEFGHIRGAVGTGTWSAGGALSTARYGAGAVGTQNAALMGAGTIGAPTFGTTCTEEYDGSTWADAAANVQDHVMGTAVGIQDGALAIGGNTPTCNHVSAYNGSVWRVVGSL